MVSFSFKILFSLAAVFACVVSTPSIVDCARLLSDPKSSSALTMRLRLDGSANCWDSLLELQSCSGEVVLFFLNGETYLGPSCCQAIQVIQHECWPALFQSLGFSTEEGNILESYCDVAAKSPPPPSPRSSSPPPPQIGHIN